MTAPTLRLHHEQHREELQRCDRQPWRRWALRTIQHIAFWVALLAVGGLVTGCVKDCPVARYQIEGVIECLELRDNLCNLLPWERDAERQTLTRDELETLALECVAESWPDHPTPEAAPGSQP